LFFCPIYYALHASISFLLTLILTFTCYKCNNNFNAWREIPERSNKYNFYLSFSFSSLSLSLSLPPLSLFFLLLLSSLILISFKKNPILLLISQFYFTPITLSRRRGFQTRNFRRWLTVIRSRVRLPNVISLRCKQNRTLPSPLRWNEFTLYAGPPFHVCDANFPCACKRQLPHR